MAAAKRMSRHPSPRPAGSLRKKKTPTLPLKQHSVECSMEHTPHSVQERQRLTLSIEGRRQVRFEQVEEPDRPRGEQNESEKNDEELGCCVGMTEIVEESENTITQQRILLEKEVEQMKAMEKLLAEQKNKVQAIRSEEKMARKREEEALAMRKVYEEKLAMKAEDTRTTIHRAKVEELARVKADKELAKAEEQITILQAELESARTKVEEEKLANQEAKEELARLKEECAAQKVIEEQNRRKAEEKMAKQEAKEAKEELTRLKAEYAVQKVVEEQTRQKAEEELAQKKAELKLARRKVNELAEIQAEDELLKKKDMDKFARQNVHEGLAKRKVEEELARIEAEFAMHKTVERTTRLKLEEELEQQKAVLELALEKVEELTKMQVEEKLAKEKAIEELAWQKVKEEMTKRNEEKLARKKAEEEELSRKKKECRQHELAMKKAEEEQELNRKNAEERQKELARKKHEEELLRNKAEQEDKRRKERERLKELARKKAEEKELARKKAEIEKDLAHKRTIEEELVRKKPTEAEEKQKKKQGQQSTFFPINKQEEDRGKKRLEKKEAESVIPPETEAGSIPERLHEPAMATESIFLGKQRKEIAKMDAATSPVNVAPTRLCIVGFISPKRLARRLQNAECAEGVDEDVTHTIRIAQDLQNQIDYFSAENEVLRNPPNSPAKGVIRRGTAWSDVALHRARAAIFEEDLREASSSSTFEFTSQNRASANIQKVPSPQRSANRISLYLSDLDSPKASSSRGDAAFDASNSLAFKLSDLRSAEEPCSGQECHDVSISDDRPRSDPTICVEKKSPKISFISPFSYTVSPMQDESRCASSSSSARVRRRPLSSPPRNSIPRLRNICSFSPEEDAKSDTAPAALRAPVTQDIKDDAVDRSQEADGVMVPNSPNHMNLSGVGRFGLVFLNDSNIDSVDRFVLDSPEDARRGAIQDVSFSPLALSSLGNTPPAIGRDLFENHAVSSDSPETRAYGIFVGTRDNTDAPTYSSCPERNFFDTSPWQTEIESVHLSSREVTPVAGLDSVTASPNAVTASPNVAETLVAIPKRKIRYTVASDSDTSRSIDRTPPHEEKTPRSLCTSPPRRKSKSPSPSVYSSPPDVVSRHSGDSDFFQRLHEDDAASCSPDEDNASLMSYSEPLGACSDEEYLSRMRIEIHRNCQGSPVLQDRDYMVRETDLSTEELLCRAADVNVFHWFDRRVQISNAIQYESSGNLETIPEYPPTMTPLRRRTCDLQLLI
eukprot:GEMP01000669.1.p1 GENE.GEMP01000669.1~~GEMP01000669.1.p1  ORF type:complete len:1245 (+),score=280.94 GEMP01000669.1:545-4279(+)